LTLRSNWVSSFFSLSNKDSSRASFTRSHREKMRGRHRSSASRRALMTGSTSCNVAQSASSFATRRSASERVIAGPPARCRSRTPHPAPQARGRSTHTRTHSLPVHLVVRTRARVRQVLAVSPQRLPTALRAPRHVVGAGVDRFGGVFDNRAFFTVVAPL